MAVHTNDNIKASSTTITSSYRNKPQTISVKASKKLKQLVEMGLHPIKPLLHYITATLHEPGGHFHT